MRTFLEISVQCLKKQDWDSLIWHSPSWLCLNLIFPHSRLCMPHYPILPRFQVHEVFLNFLNFVLCNIKVLLIECFLMLSVSCMLFLILKRLGEFWHQWFKPYLTISPHSFSSWKLHLCILCLFYLWI